MVVVVVVVVVVAVVTNSGMDRSGGSVGKLWGWSLECRRGEGLACGMKAGGGQGNGRDLGVGVWVWVWGVLCCHLAQG